MVTETAGTPAIRSRLVDILLPRATMSRPGPTDDYWYEPRTGSAAGQVVTPQTALTFSGCWAATNAIAGLFGSMPCKVYRKVPEGREEAENHPNHRLLGREPNDEMDAFVFWEMMTHWWINYGNGFAEIQRTTSSGAIVGLWPIHPTRVREEMEGPNWTGRWLVRNNDGSDSPIEDSDLFNIVGHLSENGRRGKGVFLYAAGAIGVGLAQQKYEAEFYGKGGRPSGVLKHPGKLGDQTRADMRREWRTIHQEGNEIAVLWEGMDYQSISVDPEHAKLGEAKLGTIQDMCRFYDLPPHALYELSKGTFANTEEMNRFLVSQPLNRRIVRVERASDRQLFSTEDKKRGLYVKFNVKALLRGTPKEQAEVAATELANGFISQDEYRAMTERNALPDGLGKTFWMRRDMAPIELVKDAAQREIDKPVEIPDTPAGAGTPPVPGEDVEDKLRAVRDQLGTEIAELKAENDVLLAAKESLATEKGELQALLLAAKAEHEASQAVVSELRVKVDEQSEVIATAVADRDKQQAVLDTLHTTVSGLESEIQNTKSSLGQVSSELEAVKASEATLAETNASLASDLQAERDKYLLAQADLEAAITSAEQLENQLHAAQTDLSAKETALSESRDALERATARCSELERKHESHVSKAAQRTDELKTRNEKLSSELGTVRAERDTLTSQVKLLTRSRDQVLLSITDLKAGLKAAEDAKNAAEEASTEAQRAASEQLSAARLTVIDTVRSLLTESLQFLLSQERHEVRDASKRPDQFKQLAVDYYGRLEAALSRQLGKAADAMAAAGGNRPDVGKLAAKYTADSLTKLNTLFHATKRDDLRIAVRQETEQWESRRHALVDWIDTENGGT